MLFYNLPLATVAAADAVTDVAAPVEEKAQDSLGSLMLNTTLTGLLVVFAVLLILIAIVFIYSRICLFATQAAVKKAQKKADQIAAKREKFDDDELPPYIPPMDSVTRGPVGVGDEIIAVIAAAVAAIDPSFSVKSVRRKEAPASRDSGRRSAWRSAGLRDNTRSF